MSGRKKLKPSLPSKAYLVSFGDTMTALLAFFIVLNSLAEEQTGINLYAGTGSFVSAFSSSGLPGKLTGKRSDSVIQQKAPGVIYALAENLPQNQKVGPDEVNEQQRVLDRDREQFQKFLAELEKNLSTETLPTIEDQVAYDSFQPMNRETGGLSRHAMQLLSEAITKLRQPDTSLEIILWASLPSAKNLSENLARSQKLRAEVEQSFWLKPYQRARIRYRVKPWLFSDAKRPVLSIVIGKIGSPG
jgi:flagellar motor protein MotB